MSEVKNKLQVFFELIPQKKGWWFWKTNFAIVMYRPYGVGGDRIVVGRFKTLEEAIEAFKKYREENINAEV